MSHPADWVLALTCGYRAEVRLAKVLIVNNYQAYGDDSVGSETPERPIVMAGYALPAEQWARFSDDWHAALKLRPEIKYLKMREAEGFDGQFDGMRARPEFRDLKLNDLCEVIAKHKPYAMYAWFNRADYERTIKGRIPPEVDKPHFLATNGLIELSLASQAHYGFWGPLDFIFDEQAGIEEEVKTAFAFAKSKQPPKLRDLLGHVPIFRNDLEVMPIQAADMLAWHIRRKQERPDEVRPRLERLLAGGHCEWNCSAGMMESLLHSWYEQARKEDG